MIQRCSQVVVWSHHTTYTMLLLGKDILEFEHLVANVVAGVLRGYQAEIERGPILVYNPATVRHDYFAPLVVELDAVEVQELEQVVG